MKETTMHKNKILIFFKFAPILLLIVVILPIISVISAQYIKVVIGPKYDVQNMPLNYEILGKGEKKIVLIHGLTGSLNYWKSNIDSISNTHQLLLVDLLGFGDSPKPKSDYSLGVQIEALEKIIYKEGFNNEQTVLLGHSMGSIIALALLAKHPEWFKGAVVVSVPVYSSPKEFSEIMSKSSLFNRLTVGPYAKLFCMLHPIYFMTNVFKPSNLTDDVFQDAKKHNWLSYYNSLNNLILKTDLYSYAPILKNKKIVFIHGKEDKTAPFNNAVNLANSFSNSKFITVKGGDHQLFLKNPNLIWNILQDF